MRPLLSILLLLAATGCDAAGFDLGAIDDWDGGGWGGGGGGGGGCCSQLNSIRPVVTPDIVFGVGSAFQLQVRDPEGNPISDPLGTFHSTDSTVLAVSPTGWAEARGPGSTEVLYGAGGSLIASTVFFVGVPPSTATLRLEVHGTTAECASPLNCAPAGSPIIEGWIGHSTDVRGISVTFAGADGLQPTDELTASPVPLTLCQATDFCVSVTSPSPAHAWHPGESTLCLGVTVGDSVPVQAYEDTNNREWVLTWSRPGLFILRQSFHVFVQPSLSAPAGTC
jgi:hypothetical protein